MKIIQKSFFVLLTGLTLLWLLVDYAALGITSGVFVWRSVFMQYSVVLGIGELFAMR